MAYLDDDDEEELERLAADRDDPGTIGEAMARSRAREELDERDRMDAPSTPAEPPPDVSDEMAGLDLSALDGLEENARGAATGTTPEAPPSYDMDLSGEDPGALLAESEPDADEAGGAPDADADDLGTLGAAMDYNPAEAGRMTDADLLARADEADASLARRNEENAGRWTPTAGRGVDELMPEEVAFAGPPPSRDDETWGMATDADPTLPAAGPPPIEQPFDRGAGSDDMDMGEWSRTPGDEEPVTAIPDDILDDTGEEGAAGLADPRMPPAMSSSKSTPMDRPLEEPDFTGADWSDAIRRPLHAIGAGLLAASGRGGGSPFRSDREAMQARIDARNAAKGRATESAAEADTARAGLEARTAERAADRGARASIASETAEERRRHNLEMELLAGRRADTGDMRASTSASEAASRNAERGSRTARESAMRDPSSEESRRARERLAGEIELLPASIRDTARAHLAREDWSAAEVEEAENNIPGFGRSYLSRGAGGTPSGGGRAGISDEALNAELMRLGIDEASIAVATRRQREDMLDERTGGSAAEAGAEEETLVPGVPMADVRVDLGTVEARGIRDSVSLLRTGVSSLDAIEALEREYGAASLITPEMWGELEAHTSRLLSIVGEVRNIGVIQIGEMPSVRSALPDPSSVIGTSLGRYAGSMRGWRDVIDEEVATTIGVVTDENPEAIDAALGWLHSPPRRYDRGGGEGASASGGITVRDPESGETVRAGAGELSEDEIAALIEAGYEVSR